MEIEQHVAHDRMQNAGLRGFSESEVLARRTRGLVNVAPPQTGRSSLQIVRDNVFMPLNTIRFALDLARLAPGAVLRCAHLRRLGAAALAWWLLLGTWHLRLLERCFGVNLPA